MKVIKWFFILLAFCLSAAVVSTFFMSENFRVSHAQVIKASPADIYNQIVTLKNWENWSYWYSLDDKMVTTYNDIPSGVGASYSWRSNKKEVGNGSFTIERTIVNEYIQSRLKFEGEGDGFSEYIIRTVPEGTELTSAMNSKTTGVFHKLMTRLMIKPIMIKAFKASADKMDAYLQEHAMTTPVSRTDFSRTAPDSIK